MRLNCDNYECNGFHWWRGTIFRSKTQVRSRGKGSRSRRSRHRDHQAGRVHTMWHGWASPSRLSSRSHLGLLSIRCALNCGWVGPACVYKTVHECQPGSNAPHVSDYFKIKQLEQLVRFLQSEVVTLKEQLIQSSRSSTFSTATLASSTMCHADTSAKMDTSDELTVSAASAPPPQKVSSITSVTSIAAPVPSGGLLDLLHAAENTEPQGNPNRSSPTKAGQMSSDSSDSSDLKDTAGAGVKRPHHHAVRFTQEEQKIIERAYLVFEAWRCFGEHPRAGSGGEGVSDPVDIRSATRDISGRPSHVRTFLNVPVNRGLHNHYGIIVESWWDAFVGPAMLRQRQSTKRLCSAPFP